MKTRIILITAYFFSLLFTYASINKLITFEAFQVQLSQSPLLSAYAGLISYTVIISELIIALLLCINKTRLLGLYLSYSLMVAFTIYIYLILNFSDFIPCSCGGILEKMGWTEHLWFNIGCVVIAVLAIILLQRQHWSKLKITGALLVSFIIPSALVIGLFLSSEQKVHYNNELVRRYPQRPLSDPITFKLDFNSYYIIGIERDSIFLGNYSAPRHILAVSLDLKGYKEKTITIPDSLKLEYQSATITIKNDDFYLSDLVSGVIQKGSNTDWVLKENFEIGQSFTAMKSISDTEFVLRVYDADNQEYTLGVYNQITREFNFKKGILQKNIDGVFDTDGQLFYEESLDKILYLYYYRNTYLVADKILDNKHFQKTIDTIKQVPLEFGYTDYGREKKLAKSYSKVNYQGTSSNGYIMSKSKSIGEFDYASMLKEASIIDVYDINQNRYDFSFYFYNHQKEEVQSFFVYEDKMVGITKNYLIVCAMKKHIFKNLK